MTTSYEPRGGLGGLPGEIDRLERQVELVWPEERRLLRELAIPNGARIVDIGCGSGAFAARVASAFPSADLVGVDHDPDLLQEVRRRLPGAELVVGAAEHLPLADDSVDVAIARLVLQHAADPLAVACDARRVLRPGGAFVVIDVDGGLWGIAEPFVAELARIQAKVWAATSSRGGDRMIGRRLDRILAAAGFADRSLRLYTCSSDDVGIEAMGVHLDPVGLAPFVETGVITPGEWATSVAGYRHFLATPDAYVLLVGFFAVGTA